MAEGISRQLAPNLNIWTLAEPLVANWARQNLGPARRLRDLRQEGLKLMDDLPRLIKFLRSQMDEMDHKDQESGHASTGDRDRSARFPPSRPPPLRRLWAGWLPRAWLLLG